MFDNFLVPQICQQINLFPSPCYVMRMQVFPTVVAGLLTFADLISSFQILGISRTESSHCDGFRLLCPLGCFLPRRFHRTQRYVSHFSPPFPHLLCQISITSSNNGDY